MSVFEQETGLVAKFRIQFFVLPRNEPVILQLIGPLQQLPILQSPVSLFRSGYGAARPRERARKQRDGDDRRKSSSRTTIVLSRRDKKHKQNTEGEQIQRIRSQRNDHQARQAVQQPVPPARQSPERQNDHRQKQQGSGRSRFDRNLQKIVESIIRSPGYAHLIFSHRPGNEAGFLRIPVRPGKAARSHAECGIFTDQLRRHVPDQPPAAGRILFVPVQPDQRHDDQNEHGRTNRCKQKLPASVKLSDICRRGRLAAYRNQTAPQHRQPRNPPPGRRQDNQSQQQEKPGCVIDQRIRIRQPYESRAPFRRRQNGRNGTQSQHVIKRHGNDHGEVVGVGARIEKRSGHAEQRMIRRSHSVQLHQSGNSLGNPGR